MDVSFQDPHERLNDKLMVGVDGRWRSWSGRGWVAVWVMIGHCSLNLPKMMVSGPEDGLMIMEKVFSIMSLCMW